MKRKILFAILLAILVVIFIGTTKCYAQDLDRIVDYSVTVDPRMNDGTLDITYEITWEVLDDTTEGPLEWVQIGTPNGNFDTPTALTKNIRSISQYNGSYVKIVFDKKYHAGDIIKFKYKIHQSYMYKISGGTCKYSFTPAWFTDAEVNKLTVKWNKEEVKSADTKTNEDNYLVWKKYKMKKGEKLKVEVKYDKKAFSGLNVNKQSSNLGNNSRAISNAVPYIIFILIFIISIFFGGGGGGYYRHRGFYGGGYFRRMCTF